MNRRVGRGIAITVIVVGCIWLVPLPVLLPFVLPYLIEGEDRSSVLVFVCLLLAWTTIGIIAVWRARLYLKETMPRRRLARGFSVLPPR